MIPCAVSIPETNSVDWITAVANTTHIREVELPATLLQEAGPAFAQVEHNGLHVLHVRELLPADVSRYLAEQPAKGRSDVLGCFQKGLESCNRAGTRHASFDVGLDRIGAGPHDDGLEQRVKLLRALVPAAERNRITLCVQIRFPAAFPGSKAWDHAANLVHEVMHPRCRLALSLFPAEFPEDFEVEALVRRCYFNVGVLRFHYRPDLGDIPTAAAHRQL